MDFKLGEFVRFVDENREGFITRIIDEQMVGVTGEDDFEIPVMVNNITRVYGHKNNEDKNQDLGKEANSIIENFKQRGISLAVVTDQNKGSIVHFYIINESSFLLHFTLNTEKHDKFKGEFSGVLEPDSYQKIYSAALPDLEVWPNFHIRILPYTQQNIKPVVPLIINQKFRAKDFSGSKSKIPVLGQQGWLISLDPVSLKIDAQKLKESFFEPVQKEEQKIIERPAKEVDLHIEQLRDDYLLIDKSEIFEIQLQAFQKNLEAAIAHQYSSIIFIHGLGNHTLRNQIHKIAGKHPQVKTFMDAHKEKFGYGATEIVFK